MIALKHNLINARNMYRFEGEVFTKLNVCACSLLQRRPFGPSEGRLYNRPAAGPVNLVDTELLLAIAVADAGVDVVVI